MPDNELFPGSRDILRRLERRKRRSLIIWKYLNAEAGKANYRGAHQDHAREIIKHWAEMARQGQLQSRKETAVDADFLFEIFGDALGHRRSTESPSGWELERNYHVEGVGTADGAIGRFRPDSLRDVCAVIELKGAGADLDRDKFNGRTPVNQCWDYLNALPDCPWGIVSNYVTTRLYHRSRGSLAYEEFRLEEMATTEDLFRAFYCLFRPGGLVRRPNGALPVAAALLDESLHRQREVGEKLYANYSENRQRLIAHLMHEQGKPLDRAIDIAQKLLDRIIFVAFCEDRGLLPSESIKRTYENIPPYFKVTNPRWRNFLDLFHAVDQGHLLRLASAPATTADSSGTIPKSTTSSSKTTGPTSFATSAATTSATRSTSTSSANCSNARSPNWNASAPEACSASEKVRLPRARLVPRCRNRPSESDSASITRPPSSPP